MDSFQQFLNILKLGSRETIERKAGVRKIKAVRAPSKMHRAWSMVCIGMCVSIVTKALSGILTDIDPEPFAYPPLRDLPVDMFELSDVERLFNDDPTFRGPESLAFEESTGDVYTGLADRRIVRIFDLNTSDPKYVTVTRTGASKMPLDAANEMCGTLEMEPVCGRPLGLRWDPKYPGHLLVADAYYGILRVDVRPEEKDAIVGEKKANVRVEVLVPSVASTSDGGKAEEGANGNDRRLSLTNDLDVSADGRFIFFTNTGRFPRNKIHKLLLEGQPSGQVWVYDTIQKGAPRVLADRLVMPNGITLTHSEDALLVCSTFLSGILRIDLPAGGVEGLVAFMVTAPLMSTWTTAKGNTRVALNEQSTVNTLPSTLVNDDLQGTVDNIRRYRPPDISDIKTGPRGGTYLAALGSKRAKPFSLPQLLAPFPSIRRLLSFLGLETITMLVPRTCLIVEIDDLGRMVNTITDRSGACYWASEADVMGPDPWLYVGSWRAPFLARAKLPSQTIQRTCTENTRDRQKS